MEVASLGFDVFVGDLYEWGKIKGEQTLGEWTLGQSDVGSKSSRWEDQALLAAYAC